jgi:hypothetical protein
MIFDRIIEDAISFIRRFLWWRQEQKKEPDKQPFQSIRSHSGDWGVISLVTGRDTPRAVRTWVYFPKRQTHREAQSAIYTAPQDLHFYLDFLGPLSHVHTPRAEEERKERQSLRRQGATVPTHRLYIMKASHFLNAEGLYDCELVFWGDYDFYVPGNLDPERIAMMVLDKTVFSCLKLVAPLDMPEEKWRERVDAILYEIKNGYIPRIQSRKKRPAS